MAVKQKTGFSDIQLYDQIHNRDFPKPTRHRGQFVWEEGEVNHWVKTLRNMQKPKQVLKIIKELEEEKDDKEAITIKKKQYDVLVLNPDHSKEENLEVMDCKFVDDLDQKDTLELKILDKNAIDDVLYDEESEIDEEVLAITKGESERRTPR